MSHQSDNDSIVVGHNYATDWTPEPVEPWMDDALCAQTDPEIFFPEKGGSVFDAKKVCSSCDVREQCLRYAIENDMQHGVWGGMGRQQRTQLARKQLAA